MVSGRLRSTTTVNPAAGGRKRPLMAAVSFSRNRTIAEMLQRERATDCEATLKSAIVP
jgi:hypothetical protein